ncbi:hypothetical protein K340107D12_50380 [Blautia parvula]|uniref:Uncharacterized protein n=1 Tax=Blautia parvula TaxID=2877527 RepID=A0ABQ0C0S6_9FIRM
MGEIVHGAVSFLYVLQYNFTTVLSDVKESCIMLKIRKIEEEKPWIPFIGKSRN